ncbi:MAG: hypothetical protein LBG69_00600 [Zoogloeaceae bacterium]|jgi:hypothetical protein|nr:hypothetical protein [Zoogloeaceae bacterium]
MLDDLPQEKSTFSLLTANDLQQFVQALPPDPFRAVDSVVAQLEGVLDSGMDVAARFGVVSQLDEAAQSRVKQLALGYLQIPRPGKAEENRLRTMILGFWANVSRVYGHILAAVVEGKDASAKQLMPRLPFLVGRTLVSVGEHLKWEYFGYGTISKKFWANVGRTYLLSEKFGFAEKTLQIYPGIGGISSPQKEYLKILFFQTASLNSLLPPEIELADRLIAHLLPSFVFSETEEEQSLYWVAVGSEREPTRSSCPPPASLRAVRYFHAGDAAARLHLLMQEAETANAIPVKISQDERFNLRDFLNVTQHLAQQWSKTAPQRRFERHAILRRVTVLPGFVNSYVMTAPEFGGKPSGLPLESWIVENVSRGGFGAVIKRVNSDWIRVGALLALQPEESGGWLIGVIRRVRHVSDEEIKVGIETLSKRIAALETRPRSVSSVAFNPGSPALWLQDDDPKEPIRFVFPRDTFNPEERLESEYNGRRIFLTPVELKEQGLDYEIATYKVTVAAASQNAA